MKINSTKDNLLEGMQVIQSTISSRTTLPILHNFLMEAGESNIKLVRTDLEMAAIHFINAEVVQPGSMTIPMKEFSDIIHTLPAEQEISIYTDQNKVHIHCGKSKFWVMGSPKEEYPLIPDMGKSEMLELNAAAIQDMIQKTIFAASNQETRYVLNGLLWVNGKDGFEMVATDGRRLAIAKRPAAGGKQFKLIVPTKVLYELLRFLGINKPEPEEPMSIGISDNQIGFQMRQTTFISRLVEGNFPNYEQVLPSKKEIIFEADSAGLLDVTKRAALCGDGKGAVKYQMKEGTMMVSASSQKMEFSDEVKVESKSPDFQVSFNPQYVADVLKNAAAEKMIFSMTNSTNPVLVEPAGRTDCKYIIMPVRS